jgi:hypothetical protein
MGPKRIKVYLILRFGNLSATNDAGPLTCSEGEQIIVQGSSVKKTRENRLDFGSSRVVGGKFSNPVLCNDDKQPPVMVGLRPQTASKGRWNQMLMVFQLQR